jgi:acyl-CoA reductase-like NAD-dependent aldehyde dehydrogenase
VDKEQFDKILGYIKSGKAEGAKLTTGGGRHGDKGYFIQVQIYDQITFPCIFCILSIFG